jgi:cytochrome P450
MMRMTDVIQPLAPHCPALEGRDDRKSAAIAANRAKPAEGTRKVGRFAELRDIFRSPQALQGMKGADFFIGNGNPDHMPVFFLDGEAHKRRRSAIARYFTPKAITTRYRDVIESTSDYLMAELRRNGSAELDIIAFQMAVDVTAEVVGLTEGDSRAQANRLRKMLGNKLLGNPFPPIAMIGKLWLGIQLTNFDRRDVRPAIEVRRKAPREDVISHMIQEGYSNRSMLIECMIYGTAGMITTRELITMASWHMLEDDALKQRYLAGSEDEQFAIIEEILRLEPVAGMLYRRIPEEGSQGTRFSMDLREANLDEEVTGPCPFALDPDRAKRMKQSGSYMSFGDGPHRCPGAQLALHETRVFLDKMLRLPGIRLAKSPRVGWDESIMGYELRDAIVTCDRA